MSFPVDGVRAALLCLASVHLAEYERPALLFHLALDIAPAQCLLFVLPGLVLHMLQMHWHCITPGL